MCVGNSARAGLQRWRRPLLAIGAFAVFAGCAASLATLDLRWSDVRLLPLLAVAVVIVPLSIAYGALNMMLMGRAADAPVRFGEGIRISVFAQVAELLPLPGGALIRTAALVRAGGTAGQSAGLVIAFALIWIACGGVGAGFTLAGLGWPAAALALGCGAGALVVTGWLAARHGPSIALATLALRVLGVVLVAARFVLVFAVIGVDLPWKSSFGFAFANILGSAASLIPAGLGVSEALSALIAHPAGVAPAAAFLAAALSRLIGFGINMALALCYFAVGKVPSSEAPHA